MLGARGASGAARRYSSGGERGSPTVERTPYCGDQTGVISIHHVAGERFPLALALLQHANHPLGFLVGSGAGYRWSCLFVQRCQGLAPGAENALDGPYKAAILQTDVDSFQGKASFPTLLERGKYLFIDSWLLGVIWTGDIVVALVNGEATIKRLYIADQTIELRPENPKYRPITIGLDTDLRILGKVVAVRNAPQS